MDYDYKELCSLGYGEQYVYDVNGNVIEIYCNHYYSDYGICVFCDDVLSGSMAYDELYGSFAYDERYGCMPYDEDIYY